MANTTKDIPMIESIANVVAPQSSARTKANKQYYIGQAVVKIAAVADDPSAANAAVYVEGVVSYSVKGGAADATSDDMTITQGEFLHFKNSATNPIVEGDLGKGVFFEDNQTVGRSAAAGSKGAQFLGFEDTAYGRKIKIGVGAMYRNAPNAAA